MIARRPATRPEFEFRICPETSLAEPLCLRDKCRLCLKACYQHAVTLRDDPETTDYRSVQTVDRDAIFIDTPSKSDPVLCMSRTADRDTWPTRGDCIRICPLPAGRKRHLSERCKAIMRGEDPGP